MPALILDTDWVNQNRYTVEQSGCWLWAGPVCSDGYGKCGQRAGQTLAHRAFYTILSGTIPFGTELDHLCKNRLCVNPDHLEPVSHAVNVSRGDYQSNHRNGRKISCHKGHPFTAENTMWEKGPRGSPRRKCRICTNAAQRIRRHQRKQVAK